MTVYQNMNQFSQGPVKGQISATPNPVTLSAQINPNSSDTLVPGSAVKLTAGVSGETILVDLCSATDVPWGYVIWSPKKSSFTAGNEVEVALPNSVITLESDAAIGRGNQVEFVPTGNRVKIAAGTNPISGICLDIATAAGQLVRVQIKESLFYSSSSSSCRSSSSSSSSSA